MKKCSDENLGNSAWKIGFFEYLCTSIFVSIPSPAELLNNRVYKGFSLFLNLHLAHFRYKRHSDRKPDPFERAGNVNHDKQATDLPKINEGSDVWYHDHNKDIWGKGTVIEWDQNDRSYTLVNVHGKIVSWNHIDLKKCFNKVEHKDHGEIPKPPTKSVKPKSSVTDKIS